MRKNIAVLAAVIIVATLCGLSLYGNKVITEDDIFGQFDFVFELLRIAFVAAEIALWRNAVHWAFDRAFGNLYKGFAATGTVAAVFTLVVTGCLLIWFDKPVPNLDLLLVSAFCMLGFSLLCLIACFWLRDGENGRKAAEITSEES